eukprot:GAFH01001523.1.p1 GENE.GAFH01001523.1~~GAFH01001523.1.p1  ORF type:complete len:513 (+),score=151.51 GAFH01001523.1:185-1540(+)
MRVEVEKERVPKKSSADEDEDDDVVKLYGLKDYDDEPAEEGFLDPAKDPYLTKKDDEEDEDEVEDLRILPTDNLLLAAHSLAAVRNLIEVKIFEEKEKRLFTHHEFEVSAPPICVEWVDVHPGQPDRPGHVCAIGTMHPDIELWNLNVLEPFEPVGRLGGILNMPAAPEAAEGDEPKSKKDRLKEKKKLKKKMAKRPPEFLADSHHDSVLSLSWNRLQRNVLASGSADRKVKLWDLPTSRCLMTLSHHNAEVSTLQWHPQQGNVMATGAFDGSVMVLDGTAGQQQQLSFAAGANVEKVAWHTGDPCLLLASTHDGNVFCFDIRRASAGTPGVPIWQINAHPQSSCNVIAQNPRMPRLLVTGGDDSTVKVWDLSGPLPRHELSSDPHVGKILTASFMDDDARLLAVGGTNDLKVYNTADWSPVKRWNSEILAAQAAATAATATATATAPGHQ